MQSLVLAEETTTAPSTMFPKDLWTMQITGGYTTSVEADEQGVAPLTLNAAYYFDTRHAVQMELVGYGFEDDGRGENPIGIGLNVGLRYHFLEQGRFTMFIEGIVGILQADHEFPEGGTNFNFTEQLGLGATWRLNEDIHFIIAGRFLHISNAAIKGVDENPGYNGMGGYAGVLFKF
jgi:hypothetical protein